MSPVRKILFPVAAVYLSRRSDVKADDRRIFLRNA
jgi:hypothetical protein